MTTVCFLRQTNTQEAAKTSALSEIGLSTVVFTNYYFLQADIGDIGLAIRMQIYHV